MKMSIFPRGRNFDSKRGEKEEEVANMGRNKGDDGFRGRPSQHWMMVSNQTSVSGSICQFLRNLCLFGCVVINHQKGGDCKKNGPIMPLFVSLMIE